MSPGRRVLQVLDKAPHDGGVAVHVAALSAGLRARGWTVETLRLHGRGEPPAPAQPGDRHRLPLAYGAAEGWRRRAAWAAVLADAKPDLVHLHGSFSSVSSVQLAQLRQHGPTLATLHDTRPFCFLMTRRFGPAGAPCERRCGAGCFSSGCVPVAGALDALRWARRWRVDAGALAQWRRLPCVVAPSRYIAELAVQHGFEPARLQVVPHGTALPPPASAPGGEPLVVFIGSLIEAKGPQLLLEALALLRGQPWRAVIAGTGALRDALAQRIDALGLGARVRLADYIAQRPQVDALLAQARVMAMPSLVAESFGLAGLEALAAGVPVVGFGLGGMAEWLRPGETGLVAAPCTAAALAEALHPLLADAALAQRLGRQGRAMVRQQFDPQRQIDRLGALYEQAIAAAPAAA